MILNAAPITTLAETTNYESTETGVETYQQPELPAGIPITKHVFKYLNNYEWAHYKDGQKYTIIQPTNGYNSLEDGVGWNGITNIIHQLETLAGEGNAVFVPSDEGRTIWSELDEGKHYVATAHIGGKYVYKAVDKKDWNTFLYGTKEEKRELHQRIFGTSTHLSSDTSTNKTTKKTKSTSTKVTNQENVNHDNYNDYEDDSNAGELGWIKTAEGWRFKANNGKWINDGSLLLGETYYYFKDGIMQTSQWINGYYYRANGEKAVGWEKLDGKWYLFNRFGKKSTGMNWNDGKWYYLSPETGEMLTGWIKYDHTGKWYYMQPGSGDSIKGWFKDTNGKWYYMDNDMGAMQTGWIKYNEKWYYLGSDGAMLVNTTTPDGYRVNENGEWVQ